MRGELERERFSQDHGHCIVYSWEPGHVLELASAAGESEFAEKLQTS